MKVLKIGFITLSLALFACGGAENQSPEGVTKDFISQMSEGNCSEAKKLTSGDALAYVEAIISSGCASFESNIKFVKCETSEETAKCDCEEERDGIAINYSYYFKKTEGAWLISGIEGGAKPEDIVQNFFQFLADGECENAKSLTFGNASSHVDEIVTRGCVSYATTIESIECTASKESANCTVFEVRDENGFNFQLELIKGGGLGWRITSIEGGQDPREVVSLFALYIAKGKCSEAKSIATGNAKETVQASMDAGCEQYDTRIKAVNCSIDGKTARCKCEEVRTGMEMKFDYDLEQVDGVWKVSNYAKDMEGNDI